MGNVLLGIGNHQWRLYYLGWHHVMEPRQSGANVLDVVELRGAGYASRGA